MTNEQAREIFNQAIKAKAHELTAVASLELIREYFTNPEFRKKFENYVWNLNK